MIVFANIVQFDAATGPCTFHANLSAFDAGESYEYSTRSIFGLTDDELLSALETECPSLDEIDVDDFVKIFATGLGAYSYDTSIGGSNTIPSFKIERVELIRKA